MKEEESVTFCLDASVLLSARTRNSGKNFSRSPTHSTHLCKISLETLYHPSPPSYISRIITLVTCTRTTIVNMLRRQTRERREYIYKKALESKEKQIYDRKQAIRSALASGKPLPPSLDAAELGKDLALDAAQEAPSTSIDDEYSKAGTYDPRILVTTSRDPSTRLTQFAKEVRLLFPNSTRLNRGGYTVSDLAAAARSNGITDMVVLHEHRGVPDAMVVSHFPHGPTLLFTLHNVVLRHEVSAQNSTVSEQYPHLIFEGFSSKLGERVKSALRFLFPPPKEASKRVMTFKNDRDFISFRHHVFVKTSHREVQLAEVGPRFEARVFEIKQGTLEQTEADTEWVLRPYMNSAKKRNQL